MDKNNMKRTDWLEREVARLTQHLKQSEKRRRKQKLAYEKNMENLGLKMLEFEECLKREQDELQNTLRQKDSRIQIHGELVKALQKKLNDRNCKHCDIKLNSELEWQVNFSNDISKENSVKQLPPLSFPLPDNLPNSSLSSNKYFRRPKSKLSPVAEESEVMFATNLRNIHADLNPQRFHAVLSASLQSIADNEAFFSDSESPMLIIPSNTAEFSTPIEMADSQVESSYDDTSEDTLESSSTISVATQTGSFNMNSVCDFPDDLSTPSIPNVVHPDVVIEGENAQLESDTKNTTSLPVDLHHHNQNVNIEISDRESQHEELPRLMVDKFSNQTSDNKEDPLSTNMVNVKCPQTYENSTGGSVKGSTNLPAVKEEALHNYCNDLSRLTLTLVSKEVNEVSHEISKVNNCSQQLQLYSSSFVADSINNALNDLTVDKSSWGKVPIITVDDISDQIVAPDQHSTFSDEVPIDFNRGSQDANTDNQITSAITQIVESIIPSLSNSNIVELVKKGLNKSNAEPVSVTEKFVAETFNEEVDKLCSATILENVDVHEKDIGNSMQETVLAENIEKTKNLNNEIFETKLQEQDTVSAVVPEGFNEEFHEGENEEKESGSKKKKKKKRKRKKKKSGGETNDKDSFESSDSHSLDSASSGVSSTTQLNADDTAGSNTIDNITQECYLNSFEEETVQSDMKNSDQFIVISLGDNEGRKSNSVTNALPDNEKIPTTAI